jgi:predicted GTPase
MLKEREEYEPHRAAGNIVYAGVDYARVLALAQSAADVILWDGGNNDFPFLKPDLHIVLADLQQTINATPADVVVSATPIDLTALIAVNKPVVRARYEFAELEDPGLGGIVDDYLQRSGLVAREE